MKNDREILENGVVSPLALIRWVSSEYEELIVKENGEHKILNQKAVRSILKILTIKNGISQNELAREVHLQGSTGRVALVNMDKEGLIRREASITDKRKVKVYMTSLGYDMVKRLDNSVQKMEEVLLNGLTDSEIYDLHCYLSKILKNC